VRDGSCMILRSLDVLVAIPGRTGWRRLRRAFDPRSTVPPGSWGPSIPHPRASFCGARPHGDYGRIVGPALKEQATVCEPLVFFLIPSPKIVLRFRGRSVRHWAPAPSISSIARESPRELCHTKAELNRASLARHGGSKRFS